MAMAHVLKAPTMMLAISGAAVRLRPKITKPAILESMPEENRVESIVKKTYIDKKRLGGGGGLRVFVVN